MPLDPLKNTASKQAGMPCYSNSTRIKVLGSQVIGSGPRNEASSFEDPSRIVAQKVTEVVSRLPGFFPMQPDNCEFISAYVITLDKTEVLGSKVIGTGPQNAVSRDEIASFEDSSKIVDQKSGPANLLPVQPDDCECISVSEQSGRQCYSNSTTPLDRTEVLGSKVVGSDSQDKAFRDEMASFEDASRIVAQKFEEVVSRPADFFTLDFLRN